MVGGIDYLLLFYWFIITLVLGALVSVIYRLLRENSRSNHSAFPSPHAPTISIEDPQADSRLEKASGQLLSGDFIGCITSCYEALDLLMKDCCAKLGVDPASDSMDELCGRLVSARLVGLDCQKVRFIEALAKGGAQTLDFETAALCLDYSRAIRQFLAKAVLAVGFSLIKYG
jgi:hypothetical protein